MNKLTVRELIQALEGLSANTDTDWRWRAASALRECPQWETATIVLAALQTQESNAETVRVPSVDAFTEWFCKNYPKDTIIFDPEWHAPRVYRAAEYAIRRAAPPMPEQTGPDFDFERQRHIDMKGKS
jgi:hypothetical protein